MCVCVEMCVFVIKLALTVEKGLVIYGTWSVNSTYDAAGPVGMFVGNVCHR